MATVGLFIKGTVKNAKRAAARRGIPVRDCKATPRGDGVMCHAPCSHSQVMNKVIHWYTEREGRAPMKAGRGYAPGTLLFHGACPYVSHFSNSGLIKKSLSGSKKRRRR